MKDFLVYVTVAVILACQAIYGGLFVAAHRIKRFFYKHS